VRKRASEQEKRRVKTGRKKERESHHGMQESPALRKGERQKDRERTTERERAREIEIKMTETEYARKRKGQRVQCDTGCTHNYPVERDCRTSLLSFPDSTPSHVFICRETKYFLGSRQL